MIYIDIDGVMTNIVETINKLFNTNIESLNYYDFRELSFRDQIFAIFKDTEKMNNYCRECIPNIEFINKLKVIGVEFEFLTARPNTCHDATVNWLKSFGFNQPVHHSVDKNNFMKRGDVLIDDCPKNIAKLKNGRIGYWFKDNIHRSKANISAIGLKNSDNVRDILYNALSSDYGEPGIMLTSSENSVNSGSNPCLCGETLIQTLEGLVKIKDLVGKKAIIYDAYEFVENSSFRITGENKELFRITFTNGKYVDATEYHKFISDEGRKQLKNLKKGDKLLTKWVDAYWVNTCWTIESIESIGMAEKVYCCTVPTTNTFLLGNGLWSGNCDEISLKNRHFCL